jgi:hypothetical protein
MRQVRVPQANKQVSMGEAKVSIHASSTGVRFGNQIMLPMLGILASLILLLLVVGLALNGGQVSLVADFMLTLFLPAAPDADPA